MSGMEAVTDSTDWLNTPLAALATIESSLRCQVCKDFFTTPMITSCSHTFCSICIRRYLSQEGRCPACRESDQEVKIRRNWIVEELVAQFQAGRQSILDYAQSSAAVASIQAPERPAKRRKLDTQSEPERRSTRSRSQQVDYTTTGGSGDRDGARAAIEIEDSEAGSNFEEEMNTRPNEDDLNGIISCPICSKRMEEKHINRHLDSNCQDPFDLSSPRRSSTPQTKTNSYGQAKSSNNNNIITREKLPTMNYSMLSDTGLRKKLKEIGITNHGSKELMKKRHTEWVNLWNASCDAKHPTPIHLLRKDLDQWERTLGRQIDRGPTGVMVKEFDRDGWQKSNKSDFDGLIRLARDRTAASRQKEGGGGEIHDHDHYQDQDQDQNQDQDQDQDQEHRSATAIMSKADSAIFIAKAIVAGVYPDPPPPRPQN